jgi:formylglycine-generating enzyme required for sulfatase activity
MVVIPAGSFTMGSAKSEAPRWYLHRRGPLHQVTIARAFALGRHEVTYDQWRACLRDGGCTHRPSTSGRQPVTWVSWAQAKAYLRWLSRKTGHEYRLPSEAEWAYAARRENSFGLQGIEGNVWEWVEDCWNDDYDGGPSDGNAWTTGDCVFRVLRGGSWSVNPGVLQRVFRLSWGAGIRALKVGFRIAKTLP